MEVHKHPHHVTHKKKWGEYLLEFFMLFLAVFLGFVAENVREGVVEQHREKEYVISIYNDLKKDTISINDGINAFTSITNTEDSMLACLKINPPEIGKLNRLISKDFWNFTGFSYNNKTIEQLKNSGNLRLIRNKIVLDSILLYDNIMNAFVMQQYGDLKNAMFSYKNDESKVVNYSQLNQTPLFDSIDLNKTINPSFISKNAETIANYYNKLFLHAALNRTFLRTLKRGKSKALLLLLLIKKEYHLQNE
ncbi:MAG: hypothetical protein M3004_05530 [Bacteroidota bacterium]|nr:hypothetical protein [Bacteroidota bacterium]